MEISGRPLSLRQSRPILLILLLAFLLRAAPNVWLEWREPGWHASHVNEIEFYYDDVARSLIVGEGFVHSVNPRSPDGPFHFVPGTAFHFVPPLYAWLLGFEYFVFGPNVFVAKLIHSALDSLVCLLVFLIGIRMFDRRTALMAAALYAVYPLAIVMSTRLYYQTLLNLMLCWIVLCMAGRVTVKNGVWTGIAVGLSALAKPVTLPLIALAPVVRILEGVTTSESRRPHVLWSVAFVMACTLTLLPWTIRNYMVFHRFIPVQSGAGPVLIQGSREAYLDLDVDTLRREYGASFGTSPDTFAAIAFTNHWTHLISDPVDYSRFLVKKFFLAWYNTEGKENNFRALIVQLPFLVAALLGFVGLFRSWLRPPDYYVIGLILYISMLQVALIPLVRYTLAVMPLVMLPAAAGLNWIIERWVTRHKLHRTANAFSS
jgi:4-amino-4-deoxy-L-arabinose transferase-like glycosyltransferase